MYHGSIWTIPAKTFSGVSCTAISAKVLIVFCVNILQKSSISSDQFALSCPMPPLIHKIDISISSNFQHSPTLQS